MKQIIMDYGPSPLFVLHLPNPNPIATGGTQVMLTDFADMLSPRQSMNAPSGEVYPNIIPIEMTLVEYVLYKVVAS